jgi:hypothetical protein
MAVSALGLFGKRKPEAALNNFTPRAQQVALARKEADRFNHNFVGTEHLLLGLIKLGQGTGVTVLRNMGLDLETVRQEVEMMVGTGPDAGTTGNIPYTPRVKKILALAAKQARELNHGYLGTQHILLGMIIEGDGVAGRVLKNLGVEIEKTRLEILKELDPNAERAKPAPTIRATAQPLICVRDVEASSRWYQKLLGCTSAHGGKDYERLNSEGRLILQLHRWDVGHDHGPIGDATVKAGNGLLLWFEINDFDAAVARVTELKAEIVRGPLDHAGVSQMEIWLKDLDGYTVVISSPYRASSS